MSRKTTMEEHAELLRSAVGDTLFVLNIKPGGSGMLPVFWWCFEYLIVNTTEITGEWVQTRKYLPDFFSPDDFTSHDLAIALEANRIQGIMRRISPRTVRDELEDYK